ncbi:hypothetical protein [Pseudoxanthomonas beigongshangi]
MILLIEISLSIVEGGLPEMEEITPPAGSGDAAIREIHEATAASAIASWLGIVSGLEHHGVVVQRHPPCNLEPEFVKLFREGPG